MQLRLNSTAFETVPTTLSELDDIYRLPADLHDSTQQWVDAVQATTIPFLWEDMPRHGNRKWAITCVGQEWEHEQAYRNLVADRKEGLKRLRSAADVHGGIRFSTTIEEGAIYQGEATFQVGDAMLLLHIEAAIAARDGDVAKAVANIQAILAFGEATKFEVGLPIFQTHLATFSMASHAVKNTAPERWTDQDAAAIQKALHEADFQGAWKRYSASTFAEIYAEVTRNTPLYLRVLNQREALVFFETANLPTPMSWSDTYNQHVEAIIDIEQRHQQSVLHRHVYTPFISNAHNTHAISNIARIDTERRCAIVILALVRHRIRHGKFPTTMEEIDLEHFPNGYPVDPWLDDEPIKFKRLSTGGYVVYGVGEDGIDDDGKIKLDPTENRFRDVGFTWHPTD